MDDRDKEVRQDDEGTTDDMPMVSTPGILAGNLTAGNSASSMMTGMVGGGPAGGVAAKVDAEGEEESTPMNLDALGTLEAYGDPDRRRSDEGITQSQSELEAGEMNG